MNHLKVRQWVGVLAVIACLVVSAWPALADTIKLKDGTVLEGDIISEDATAVTIKAEFANGSIVQNRSVPKIEIGSLIRSTPEEKAARDAQRDYREVTKYALDTNTSKPLAEYDRVIDGVFRDFLTRHPNSAYQQDVEQRIAKWQVDRDQVAAGKTKYRGAWLPADEAAKLQSHDNVEQALQRATNLIAQQKFEQAVNELKAMQTANVASSLEVSRRQSLREAYGLWITMLENQIQMLDQENQHHQQRLQAATKSVQLARNNLMAFQQTQGDKNIGYRSLLNQHEGAVQRAEAEEMKVERLMDGVREQQAEIRQQLTRLHTQSGFVNVSAPASPESAPPAGSGDLMTQLADMLQWIKDHWLLLLIGAVVALWLVSHLLR